MAIQTSATILSIYKADTRQHKAKLKELKGEEKKRHKALVDQVSAQNLKLDAQIAKIGKIGAAIGVAVGAVAVLGRAFKVYAKEQQLAIAAGKADVEGLRTSFGALAGRMKTLRFAAAAMNGRFAVTNEQMQTAAKFMNVLVAEGNDVQSVFEKVTQAIVEADSGALKPFGDDIKAVNGEAKGLSQILDHMAKRVQENTKEINPVLRVQLKLQNAVNDAWLAINRAMGKVAETFAPLVERVIDATRKLGKFVSVLDEMRQKAEQLTGGGVGKSIERGVDFVQNPLGSMVGQFNRIALAVNGATFEVDAFIRSQKRLQRELAADAKTADLTDESPLVRPKGLSIAERNNQLLANVTAFRKRQAKQRKKGARRNLKPTAFERIGLQGQRLRDAAGFAGAGDNSIPLFPGISQGQDIQGIGSAFGGIAAGATPSLSLLDQQDLLSRTPSAPTTELSKLFSQQGSSAIKNFESASTQAFRSIVTGASSAAAAIKQAFGQMIMAQSMDLFAKGIGQGVQALISLVGGNPAAAAGHGKASAMAFAGAATLGALASQLGVGGRLPGKPAGLGGAAGAAGGNTTTNRTIIIGGGFGEEDPRRRAARMRKALDAEGPDTTFLDG